MPHLPAAFTRILKDIRSAQPNLPYKKAQKAASKEYKKEHPAPKKKGHKKKGGKKAKK